MTKLSKEGYLMCAPQILKSISMGVWVGEEDLLPVGAIGIDNRFRKYVYQRMFPSQLRQQIHFLRLFLKTG